VRTEDDAAFTLLQDYVDNPSVPLKTNAITGYQVTSSFPCFWLTFHPSIGLAYAGSHREGVIPLLLPHVSDEGTSMEVASLSALALGFIFVGSCNGEITSSILETLMERDDAQLDEKWARFMVLGLALLFLGRTIVTSLESHAYDGICRSTRCI
jgi:26S proteasome regulatory subunit N1